MWQRTLSCQQPLAMLHLDVRERHAFQAEPGDDDRSHPRAVFLRKIDNDGQFVVGNVRSPLPPAADYVFCSTRQRRSDDQDCDQAHECAGGSH